MSIPRLAIQRPVTMFMLSGVIVLLGAISLTKLPVDLMPEFTAPVITINTNYANVGPLEIEELITRPIEQSVSAVAGITRVDSSSREGGSNVRLNFGWGTNLDAAADDVRSRLDRVRGRLPEEADPPIIFKADSNAFPIMQIGVEGDYDPVTLRELAENDLSPRLERAPGVAAVTIGGGLRRQIHVDLSKEKITAMNLSVDRVITAIKSENQNLPLGEVDQGDSTYLVRSQGQFNNLDDIRNLVVMTRAQVPAVGTLALLYFGGFALNTMTSGGLALGIGMIVDAAIVVLENTHRHLEMGKDRMTAAIDGSEEVWSAILASTLTHIAVFVPLLFLQGISSILFTQ